MKRELYKGIHIVGAEIPCTKRQKLCGLLRRITRSTAAVLLSEFSVRDFFWQESSRPFLVTSCAIAATSSVHRRKVLVPSASQLLGPLSTPEDSCCTPHPRKVRSDNVHERF